MKNKLKLFGIKTITLNGTEVSTFNVSIKCNDNFKELAERNGITVHRVQRISKTNKPFDVDNYIYTSLSPWDFSEKVIILGNILFNNAQKKLNTKYNWCDKRII